MAPNVNGVTVTSADGSSRDLASDNGNVLLIVNVASRCGFTRQYAGLQQLQERYSSKGLKVIGFPCNDFGGQEPGTLEEIQAFCSSTYGVSFELMGKVGANSSPFDILTQAEPAGAIAWNFEKFLVGKDGTVLSRFKSGVEPDSSELMSAIEAALAA
jgi:glutathione peroxidase